ncbi:MAG: hypothetical protein IPI60_15490 [Saprospiraceae bacterium]|nr:hypothetical protein [Saprospiraceae bacterium]
MKTRLICFYASISFLTLQAQTYTPEQLGWKSFSIETEFLGKVNYFVTAQKIDEEKPLLVYLDGSGAMPLFQYTDRGIGSSVALPYRELSDKYHFVIISKPGVPFIDSVGRDPISGAPLYEPPQEYDKRLSLDWRVNAADLVLKECFKNLLIDSNQIGIIGISEGFQVGAKLLDVNESITHAMLLVGNGLNQMYDFVIQNRREAEIGKISAEQAQENIDSLYLIFDDIYANPQSTSKKWYGHTYLRWSSFCQNIPLESIIRSDIPIYIIACSQDHNTTALGADYIKIESLRKRRTNIHYLVLPYDHYFNEMIKDDSGKIVSSKSHIHDVIQDALDWWEVQSKS